MTNATTTGGGYGLPSWFPPLETFTAQDISDYLEGYKKFKLNGNYQNISDVQAWNLTGYDNVTNIITFYV